MWFVKLEPNKLALEPTTYTPAPKSAIFPLKLELSTDTSEPFINNPAPTFLAELALKVEFMINASFPTMKTAPPSLLLALFSSNLELVTLTLFPLI